MKAVPINQLNAKMNVLIADPNALSSSELAEFLSREQFNVTVENEGNRIGETIENNKFNLTLVDLEFAEHNSLSLLKMVLSKTPDPVVVTSNKEDLFTKLVALELGADDFLVKPYDNRELLARFQAIIRRQKKSQANDNHQSLLVNDINLSIPLRSASYMEQALHLTGHEYEVLQVLMRNAGAVVSKEQISTEAFGRALTYEDRRIDVHVYNIRKKIAAFTNEQKIKTVHRLGYVMLRYNESH